MSWLLNCEAHGPYSSETGRSACPACAWTGDGRPWCCRCKMEMKKGHQCGTSGALWCEKHGPFSAELEQCPACHPQPSPEPVHLMEQAEPGGLAGVRAWPVVPDFTSRNDPLTWLHESWISPERKAELAAGAIWVRHVSRYIESGNLEELRTALEHPLPPDDAAQRVIYPPGDDNGIWMETEPVGNSLPRVRRMGRGEYRAGVRSGRIRDFPGGGHRPASRPGFGLAAVACAIGMGILAITSASTWLIVACMFVTFLLLLASK